MAKQPKPTPDSAAKCKALRQSRGGWEHVPDAEVVSFFDSLHPETQQTYLSAVATSPADAAAKASI